MEQKQIYIFDEKSYSDLRVYNAGMEKCNSLHAYGPAVRVHFLIHLVMDGSGFYETAKKRYTLEKGDAFLIFPHDITYYCADAENPWSYIWIEFDGLKAHDYIRLAGFSEDNPVYSSINGNTEPEAYLLKISQEPHNAIKVNGYAHLFFESLIANSCYKPVEKNINSRELYVKASIDYIHNNYWRPIRINELAHYCGVDRSYLSGLFKQFTGVSPQQYIINFKIERAKQLMLNRAVSVGDAARSVGYSDPLAFSGLFKKYEGKSPSEWLKYEQSRLC